MPTRCWHREIPDKESTSFHVKSPQRPTQFPQNSRNLYYHLATPFPHARGFLKISSSLKLILWCVWYAELIFDVCPVVLKMSKWQFGVMWTSLAPEDSLRSPFKLCLSVYLCSPCWNKRERKQSNISKAFVYITRTTTTINLLQIMA